MAHFITSIDIPAPASEVWAFVSDSRNAPRWFSGVIAARVDGELRYMTLANGAEVVEKILELDADRRVFRYSILTGLPAEGHLGTVIVTGDEAGTHIDYTTEGEPETLMARLAGSVDAALEELRARFETRR